MLTVAIPVLAEKKDEREKPNKHRQKSNGSTVHDVHSPSNGDGGPHSRTLTPVDGITTVALHSANDETWIQELFQGTLVSTTKCLNCETVILGFDDPPSLIFSPQVSSKDENFLDLSIDVEENTSITTCLRVFSNIETLSGESKYYCETCSSKQEATKRCVRTAGEHGVTSRLFDRMCIKKLPRILALHLKRFKYFEVFKQYKKLSYRVVFPFELRLLNTVCNLPFSRKLLH